MAETGGITVRRAEPEDFGRIETLLRDIGELHRMHRPDIFGDAAVKYSSDEFAEILADAGRPVYVACGRDGTVIGYAFCVIRDIKETKLLNERREMYLDDLCVDGSFRGQGVGSILFRHVSDEAARFGCTSLELNVWSFNSPAIAFYEKMGMKPRNTHYEIRVGDGGDAAGSGNGRLKKMKGMSACLTRTAQSGDGEGRRGDYGQGRDRKTDRRDADAQQREDVTAHRSRGYNGLRVADAKGNG